MDNPLVTLTVRKLEIDLSDGFDRHWHGGDAFRSMYYNALSMSFPAGEQTFIDAVRDALPLLPEHAESAQQRTAIRDFIAQESTHRRVHDAYNAQLERQGLVNHCQRWIQRRNETTRKRGLSVMHRLAITAAFEHCTAVFSDGTLRHASWFDGADPRLCALWRWHAAEEIEHKAIAFDLYQALGGGHAARIGWYCYALLRFGLDAACQTTLNLWHDGSLFQPATWRSALRLFFGKEGVAWHGAPLMLRYFQCDFHPDNENNRALSDEWLQEHAHLWRRIHRK